MTKSTPNLKHPFPFDPTYGYDLERLLKVGSPEGPEDFAAFWEATYAESLAIDQKVTKRAIASPHPDFDLYEIEYNSLGNFRAGGWLTVPHKYDPAAGGWIVGHGYGGRDAANFDLPAPTAPALFYCARGFHRSAHPDFPSTSDKHVIHGIEKRETYSHRGSVADTWGAATALLSIFPEAVSNLRYYGGSFGGGIGALSVAWEKRLSKAYLDVPSFGNHPLRVKIPCVGSGESVRQYYLKHPEVMDVLSYFDSATAARHIKVPTFVSPALFDPAVPPPGQFAVYNAIPGEKALYLRSASHFASIYDEPENREIHQELSKWFPK